MLDLRGMPRDENSLIAPQNPVPTDMDAVSTLRLDALVANLRLLGKLIKTRNAFHTDKRGDIDFPASVTKGCTEEFDGELLHCRVQDFFTLVKHQRELVGRQDVVENMEGKIRSAEMEMSLAVASNQSLEMVRQRLELLATDRQKRFEVLKQMVEEVCLREMNLHVQLEAPGQEKTLLLHESSALGLFGYELQKAGEPLPLG